MNCPEFLEGFNFLLKIDRHRLPNLLTSFIGICYVENADKRDLISHQLPVEKDGLLFLSLNKFSQFFKINVFIAASY